MSHYFLTVAQDGAGGRTTVWGREAWVEDGVAALFVDALVVHGEERRDAAATVATVAVVVRTALVVDAGVVHAEEGRDAGTAVLNNIEVCGEVRCAADLGFLVVTQDDAGGTVWRGEAWVEVALGCAASFVGGLVVDGEQGTVAGLLVAHVDGPVGSAVHLRICVVQVVWLKVAQLRGVGWRGEVAVAGGAVCRRAADGFPGREAGVADVRVDVVFHFWVRLSPDALVWWWLSLFWSKEAVS